MRLALFSLLMALGSLAPRRGPVPAVRGRKTGRVRRRLADDTGAATAEYAIVIMAGVAFAGALVAILRSGQVQQMLTDLVQRALTVA